MCRASRCVRLRMRPEGTGRRRRTSRCIPSGSSRWLRRAPSLHSVGRCGVGVCLWLRKTTPCTWRRLDQCTRETCTEVVASLAAVAPPVGLAAAAVACADTELANCIPQRDAAEGRNLHGGSGQLGRRRAPGRLGRSRGGLRRHRTGKPHPTEGRCGSAMPVPVSAGRQWRAFPPTSGRADVAATNVTAAWAHEKPNRLANTRCARSRAHHAAYHSRCRGCCRRRC